MIHSIKKIISFILFTIEKIVAPQVCFNCTIFIDQRAILCDSCLSLIKPVVSLQIPSGSYNVAVHAVGAYTDPLKKMVLAKSNSQPRASYLLAQLIINSHIFKNLDFDIVVPIPLHWTRYAWRGFNQSEIIARRISKASKKPVLNLLKRTRKTAYQSKVTGKERIDNVSGAFELTKISNDLSGKSLKILVVDDLYTSGATIAEAIEQLKKLKPQSIIVFVAARVVKE